MPTFGDTTAGGDEFPISDGRCLVDRFNLPEAGTINSGWARSGASSTSGASWKFVILADAAGAPGSVLHVSSATAINAASTWYQFTGMSGSLAAGDYWLGVVGNSFQGYLGEDASGTSPDVCMANGTFDYASPPGSWPGTDANYSVGLNVYVDYSVAGGGAARMMHPYRTRRS